MGIEIQSPERFDYFQQATAAKLNNFINGAYFTPYIISIKSSLNQSMVDLDNDLLLIYDASSNSLKKSSVKNTIEALIRGTSRLKIEAQSTSTIAGLNIKTYAEDNIESYEKGDIYIVNEKLLYNINGSQESATNRLNFWKEILLIKGSIEITESIPNNGIFTLLQLGLFEVTSHGTVGIGIEANKTDPNFVTGSNVNVGSQGIRFYNGTVQKTSGANGTGSPNIFVEDSSIVNLSNHVYQSSYPDARPGNTKVYDITVGYVPGSSDKTGISWEIVSITPDSDVYIEFLKFNYKLEGSPGSTWFVPNKVGYMELISDDTMEEEISRELDCSWDCGLPNPEDCEFEDDHCDGADWIINYGYAGTRTFRFWAVPYTQFDAAKLETSINEYGISQKSWASIDTSTGFIQQWIELEGLLDPVTSSQTKDYTLKLPVPFPNQGFCVTITDSLDNFAPPNFSIKEWREAKVTEIPQYPVSGVYTYYGGNIVITQIITHPAIIKTPTYGIWSADFIGKSEISYSNSLLNCDIGGGGVLPGTIPKSYYNGKILIYACGY